MNDFFQADPEQVQPFVHEDDGTVSMYFDLSSIQSRMRADDPTALELDYTRTMMGFLLFRPAPRSMLMIGLGGGSLPKYCHRYLPDCDITVVEINPQVIDLRNAFVVPPDNRRFRVVCDDGAAFVARRKVCYDIVLVDGFNAEGQPEALCTQRFYDDCRAAVSDAGVLVVNLHADDQDCPVMIGRLASSFDDALLVVGAERGGNSIVFAGPGCRPGAALAEWQRRCDALAEVHRHTLRGVVTRLQSARGAP